MKVKNKCRLGIAAVLFLMCTTGLTAQVPDWTVDYSQFQFRMTVSVVLERGGASLALGENKVAVFVGNEIRGVGYANSYHKPTDRYLAIFQIGSNVSEGEELRFLIYDEERNEIAVARYTATFTSDGLLGSVTKPIVLSDNLYPTSISLTATSYEENLSTGEVIATLSTEDGDDSVHLYTVSNFSSQLASDLIRILENQIFVENPANFEIIQSFSFTLSATDPLGATVNRSVVFDILDKPEAPTQIQLSNFSIAENNDFPKVLGFLSTSDEDFNESSSYSFTDTSSNADSTFFQISGDTLKVSAAIDYELTSALQLQISSADKDGLIRTEIFEIIVADVNEPPLMKNQTFRVNENIPIGSVIGKIDFSDPDNNQEVQLTIVEADLPFSIDVNTGDITTTATIDYEMANQYTFLVEAKDNGNPILTTVSTISLQVTDVNEKPTSILLSDIFLKENSPIGTYIGNLIIADEDEGEAFSYELLADQGLDHTYFELIDDQLVTVKNINKEINESYSLDIRIKDKANHVLEQTVFVFVIDENEPPIINDTMFIINENLREGDLIGQIFALDPDENQSLTFELSSSIADLPMTIIPETGQIFVTGLLDYETRSEYYLSVGVIDNGVPALQEVVALRVRLRDLNEPPSEVLLTNATVSENLNSGTLVGVLETIDPDEIDFHNYQMLTINGQNNPSAFVILDNKIFTNASLNYESEDQYELLIRSFDKNGLFVDQSIQLDILDVNEAPMLKDTTYVILENVSVDALVGALVVEDDDLNQAFSYEILAQEFETFRLEGDQLKVNQERSLDYEVNAQFNFQVVVSDNGTPSLLDTAMITVKLQDIPEGVLSIRNYLSPNGDNINDFLTIENPEIYPDFTLKIFTPQGRKVYQKTNYDNSWDGYFQGQPLPSGVYQYVFANSAIAVKYQGLLYIKDR